MKARRHSLWRYLPPSPDLSTHFTIARGDTRRGFEHLPCLLATAWADGRFELLSPAWDVLGYPEEELIGRRICELVALEPGAACSAIGSLLTEGGAVAFGLFSKGGREMKYHWNRHFDDFTASMLIIGDALRATRAQRGRGLSFHTR